MLFKAMKGSHSAFMADQHTQTRSKSDYEEFELELRTLVKLPFKVKQQIQTIGSGHQDHVGLSLKLLTFNILNKDKL